MTKPKENKPKGRYISEVVDMLKHRGFNVTAQMLRKYQNYGISLLDDTREKGQYRVYDEESLEVIQDVFLLRFLDYPMKQIKEFVDLEQQIVKSPMVETIKEWVEDLGDFRYVRRIRLDVKEKQEGYKDLVIKIKRFREMCDIVNEKLDKAESLIKRGKFSVTNKKVSV